MLLSVDFGGTQVVIPTDFWPGKLGRIYVLQELVGAWVLEELSTQMTLWLPN